MKKFVAILFFVSLLLSSCSSYKDIRLTSAKLASFSPSGIRGVNAVLKIGIDNPAPAFVLKNMTATIKDSGTPIAYAIAENIQIEKKTNKIYEVPISGKLADGFSVIQLFSFASRTDFSALSADIDIKITLSSGIGKTIALKDIPLEQYLK